GEPFAVTPVVDCEPPARDVRQCRPSPTVLRRRNTHPPQRHPPAPAMPLPMRQAAAFADAALRRVLEVIDRRRPIGQLNGLLAAGLVDSVLSANRRVGNPDGVAVLRRVRLQPVSGLAAAEVFGCYSRGHRTHAIACRIERCAGRWQVVALHIG
ncbi:MAG TPA: Rv3235 family protein, partial [Mycobacterium sp.]|nr:Rv3235 family protein [Mycobacterium sp.]